MLSLARYTVGAPGTLLNRLNYPAQRIVGVVAELKAKRETAINAYMASMLARSEITSRPSRSTA